MTNDAWTPAFKAWPVFALAQPTLPPERITPAELQRRVQVANRQHEANITGMALAAIMGSYRCEIRDDEDGVYPCDSIEDFYIMDEHHVHCYSLNTEEYVGEFFFIPNNGSPAECFADWTTWDKTFDEFLDGIVGAIDE